VTLRADEGRVPCTTASKGASLAMALLTGVALLCYVGVLARAGALHRRAGRVSAYLSCTDYPASLS
jgi:hypothetical protein